MIQTLIFFSQPRFKPIFTLSYVWNSAMFPIIFYKFWTCSDNAKIADFLFKCLLVISHTFHFKLFASTLLKISFEVLLKLCFKFILRRSFLQKNKIEYKNIYENHKKTLEIVILTDRCIIKKMVSKKNQCKCCLVVIYCKKNSIKFFRNRIGLLFHFETKRV